MQSNVCYILDSNVCTIQQPEVTGSGWHRADPAKDSRGEDMDKYYYYYEG